MLPDNGLSRIELSILKYAGQLGAPLARSDIEAMVGQYATSGEITAALTSLLLRECLERGGRVGYAEFVITEQGRETLRNSEAP
jgi:hypothetical protein